MAWLGCDERIGIGRFKLDDGLGGGHVRHRRLPRAAMQQPFIAHDYNEIKQMLRAYMA